MKLVRVFYRSYIHFQVTKYSTFCYYSLPYSAVNIKVFGRETNIGCAFRRIKTTSKINEYVMNIFYITFKSICKNLQERKRGTVFTLNN